MTQASGAIEEADGLYDGVEAVVRPRAHVLGVGIDVLQASQLIAKVVRLVDQGRSSLICYVNAECLNRVAFDRRYRAILSEADLVYADGIGVVWASRLTSQPLPERITMGDALPEFCRVAERRGWRVYFLAGTPGVARRAATRLKKQFPHLQVVGMGVPRQEKWLWQHRHQLNVPRLWGVGALFDYYSGKMPRAPVWMRWIGLEWCFRLLIEPQRLWKRYLLGNVFFIVRACALLLVDAMLVTAAWLGGYSARAWLNPVVALPINPAGPYVTATPAIVGIWLATCAAIGLYQRWASMSVVDELMQVLQATLLSLVITMATAFLFKELDLGRSVVLPAGVLTFVFLSCSRMLLRAIERRLARRGIGLRRVLIVGTGTLAMRVRQDIMTWPEGYEVVGYVATDDKDVRAGGLDGSGSSPDVLGSIRELNRLIEAHRVQDVFVASSSLDLDQQLNLMGDAAAAADFHIVSEELESVARRLPLSRVVELPLLHLPMNRPRGWYAFSKRLFDVAAGACALITCAPLCVAIAAGIWLESRHPVVFTQERIGRAGRRFRMYKFRTMHADTDPYGIAPNELDDPRVTPLGRVLRRWSLDELPQLWNVIIGDMSLVGPRPEMPFLVEAYEPWQRWRLAVRPGLTGLWQVSGRKELPLHGHTEYDLYYVRHRSWLLDATILVRTIPAVLFRRGAF
jgi:exopolysaccharide biosynthesis polyprenyl glycosylphosphotransferase